MNILRCIFVIIGAIIGAGFASGKEIYSFFFIYGIKGVVGIAFSTILIGYIIFKALIIIKKYDINNYDDFLKIVLNKKSNKKINLETIINFIINCFLLITFYIMCAGFSAYFYQEFGINYILSGILIAIISYLILNKNVNGVFFINSFLIPVIIFILLLLGIKSYNTIENFPRSINTWKWFLKAILYASYNTVTLISILIPIKKYINNKKDALKITILSIIIIFIMALIIIILLLNLKCNISEIELPAVYASRNFGK